MRGMENSNLFAGLFVLVLLPIALNIGFFVIAVIRARRDPPLAEIIARDYATKQDMKTLETRISADLAAIKREHSSLMMDFRTESRAIDGEIFNLIRQLTSSTSHSFTDLVKTLGRIEGKIENCPALAVFKSSKGGE